VRSFEDAFQILSVSLAEVTRATDLMNTLFENIKLTLQRGVSDTRIDVFLIRFPRSVQAWLNAAAMASLAVFAILDIYAPSVGSSARTGAGFGIGANLVGFPRF
jgi:hypothetical protein